MINIGGLDFGNSKCVVSIPKGNDVHIELNSHSNSQTPTMVTISNGERYSGELSMKLQSQLPYVTFTHLRDLIRFPYDEFISQPNTDSIIKNSLISLPGNKIGINVMYYDKEIILRPEQIVAYLLRKLSSNKIKSFVTSINPFSSDQERRSLLNSFKIAKIDCPLLLNSTTAAAIAYSIQFSDFLPTTEEEPAKVIFIDIGESQTTFTLSNIQMHAVEILDTYQFKEISGSIISEFFEKFLIEKLIGNYSINPERNPEDLMLFKRAADKAKTDLATNNKRECLFVFQPSISKIVCKLRISFDEFELALQDPLCKLGRQLQSLTRLYIDRIYDIQFLGGSFQIEMLKKVVLGQISFTPFYQINRNEFISLGCGYVASYLDSNTKLQFRDIFSRHCALVNEQKENLLIIEKSFNLPYVKEIEVNVTKKLKLSIYDVLDKELNNELVLSKHSFADITISTGFDEELKVNLTLKINENGLFEFSNGFFEKDDQKMEAEVKAVFVGDLTEEEINESIKIEEEMLIDDAKLDLKLQFDEFKDDFYNFIDPAIVDEVKSQVSSLHSWFNKKKIID